MMRKLTILCAVMAFCMVSFLPAKAQDESKNIADIVSEIGDFRTLATALEAAELADTLRGEGPFTLFAPTDAAFGALPAGTVEALLANPEVLAQVLSYHLVPGRYLAADLVTVTSLETAYGDTLTLALEGNTFRVNQASILTIDISASNGIIHAIDTVILPPDFELPEAPAPDETTSDVLQLRVSHLSADVPAVDVFLNNAVAFAAVEYGAVSTWVTIPAGELSISVTPTGADMESVVLGPSTYTFEANTWVTVVVVGTLAADNLQASLVIEDFAAAPADLARITFVHAISGAPAVDIRTGDGNVLFTGLEFGQIASFEAPPNALGLEVTLSDATAALVAEVDAPFNADRAYFIAAAGLPEDSGLVVSVTNLALARQLIGIPE